MPPLHPLIVHFPIVLVYVAGVLYAIGLFRNHPHTSKMGFFVHVAALIGCIVAIVTGDYEQSQLAKTPEIHEMIEWHETLGMISTWSFGLLGVWSFLRQGSQLMWEKFTYLVVFWGMIGLLSYSAHVGGAMVYGHGIGIRESLPQEMPAIPTDTVKLSQ